MLLLSSLFPWMLLAFLGQQVSPSSGERSRDREATVAAGRAQRSDNKPAAHGKGKFPADNKMQCTWAARDVADTVRLSVNCENPEARIKGGVTDLQCEYNGKPQRCQGYQSDPKGFWKQVARAFKRLRGKVCHDDRALVKAGMCKRAPRDAHFKLDLMSSVSAGQSGEPEIPKPLTPFPSSRPTNCTGRADHRKKAEEHCSGSWVSLCSFFFSMLQSDDC